MTRPFTGFHMLGLTVAFFAVVVGVNMVMATLATRTFGGTVVENSYVASQRFNQWLDKARAQSALGWVVNANRRGDRVHLTLSGLDRAAVDALAIHPLGRLPAMRLHFERISLREYRSREPLPAGRWRLEIHLRRGSEAKDFVAELSA
ncbi:FixH family protein [Rhizorhabdus dicambivorans]|uniref:Nitrogen fixation protein FixH n=2 Tax=Rhizorhabdus dicambivorans TaxID=1850238 RepID=A0A2A4FPL3_9SPHN|nr:nitrogen fixation protein FixH [Rhizorhabdus dicambivorans]PCE40685.1 nitrogen fixation protein FixH [Rhizorhabdus dicambivorans]